MLSSQTEQKSGACPLREELAKQSKQLSSVDEHIKPVFNCKTNFILHL
jgi:hypothetical protein